MFFALFLFISDSMEMKAWTVETAQPSYRLVLKDLNFTTKFPYGEIPLGKFSLGEISYNEI